MEDEESKWTSVRQHLVFKMARALVRGRLTKQLYLLPKINESSSYKKKEFYFIKNK